MTDQIANSEVRTEQRTRFFMVRVYGGKHPPRRKIDTYDAAVKEAERLARKTGKPATVLASLTRIEPPGPDGIVKPENVQPSLI